MFITATEKKTLLTKNIIKQKKICIYIILTIIVINTVFVQKYNNF